MMLMSQTRDQPIFFIVAPHVSLDLALRIIQSF